MGTMRLLIAALIALPAFAADLSVGDTAPGFELEATDGNVYRLSDFADKEAVVLAWFPKAYTRGCTIECKSLAENGHLLKGFNATYLVPVVQHEELAPLISYTFSTFQD